MSAYINSNAHLSQLQHSLSRHYASAAGEIRQLSSGHRINRSGDDPARMAQANDIHAEVRALAAGGRNAQHMIHMLQVAEGTMSSMSSIINRMQELAVQAASDPYSDTDRQAANAEFQSLLGELNRTAEAAAYNGVSLLDRDMTVTHQSGPTPTGGDVSQLKLRDMRPTAPHLNIDALSIDQQNQATQAIDRLQAAAQAVMAERSRVGAFQQRMANSAATSASAMEQLNTSESSLRSVDVASSAATLTQSQIRSQSALSMTAQANVDIERILMLLRG